MLDRLNPVLRIACLALAGLVLFQAARLFVPKSRAVTSASIGNYSSAAAPASSANRSTQIPPSVQAQLDKIRDSQILGQIMRPPPMALIGIAGRDIILRGPNGQTGLLREGEELAGIKLLKIGTNRVLIEQAGQQKELTLFQGFGSDSLITKEEKPSEAPTAR